jgi:hypothetical protein
MSSWDHANRGEKLGLVWRNIKKISQIINDYLYLLFFLIILCKIAIFKTITVAPTGVRIVFCFAILHDDSTHSI